MPEFVEQLFSPAPDRTGRRIEPRKDGERLLRIEHVPRALGDDRLQAVKRPGPPHDHYLTATVREETRERAEHEDAVLPSGLAGLGGLSRPHRSVVRQLPACTTVFPYCCVQLEPAIGPGITA